MKKGIHSTYTTDAKATCSCGAVFVTGGTQDVHTELCSQCHPFYTGKQKLVDTAGRVEKFQAKAAAAKKFQESKEKAKKDEK